MPAATPVGLAPVLARWLVPVLTAIKTKSGDSSMLRSLMIQIIASWGCPLAEATGSQPAGLVFIDFAGFLQIALMKAFLIVVQNRETAENWIHLAGLLASARV